MYSPNNLILSVIIYQFKFSKTVILILQYGALVEVVFYSTLKHRNKHLISDFSSPFSSFHCQWFSFCISAE